LNAQSERERERERDVSVYNLVESNGWLWRHWLYFHLRLPFLFNGVSALLGGQAGSISRVLGEGGPTLCATHGSAHTQAPVLFVSAPFVVLLENVGKIEENGYVPHCTSLLVSISSTCSCWVGVCLHYVDFLWNLNYVLVLTIHLCEKNFVSSMLRIMSTNVREFATTFYEFLQVLFDDNANFIVDLLAFPSYTYPTCNWCLALNNSQKIWLENEKN
jgi:hypothetical protein